MASLFETFVNDNLPSTVRTAIPEFGNLVSGVPLIPNGTGLNMIPSKNFGFKPKNSIYVSLTDPKADFNNIGDALVYAKTITPAYTTGDNIFALIFLDEGTYELNGVDLSGIGVDNTMIQIIGVGQDDMQYSMHTLKSCLKSVIVLNAFNDVNYAIKMKYTFLNIKNCYVKTLSDDNSNTNRSFFNIMGGGLWFDSCYILAVVASRYGTGVHKFLNIYSKTGVSVSLQRCYFHGLAAFGGLKDYTFFDLTNTSHPYLYINNSNIRIVGLLTTGNIIFFNSIQTDTSTLCSLKIRNNFIRIDSSSAGGLYEFIKTSVNIESNDGYIERNTFLNHIGSANTYVNIFVNNTNVSSINNILKFNLNTFINGSTHNNLVLLSTNANAKAILNNCIYQGLMTKKTGDGTLVEQSIGTTPITFKTVSYTVTDNDFTVVGDHANTPIVFTFPSASGNIGKEFIVKNINDANVIVSGVLSQTIDGSGYLELTKNQAMTIKSTGTNYIVTNKYTG